MEKIGNKLIVKKRQLTIIPTVCVRTNNQHLFYRFDGRDRLKMGGVTKRMTSIQT